MNYFSQESLENTNFGVLRLTKQAWTTIFPFNGLGHLGKVGYKWLFSSKLKTYLSMVTLFAALKYFLNMTTKFVKLWQHNLVSQNLGQ